MDCLNRDEKMEHRDGGVHSLGIPKIATSVEKQRPCYFYSAPTQALVRTAPRSKVDFNTALLLFIGLGQPRDQPSVKTCYMLVPLAGATPEPA
jgi:hypothetical protein